MAHIKAQKGQSGTVVSNGVSYRWSVPGSPAHWRGSSDPRSHDLFIIVEIECINHNSRILHLAYNWYKSPSPIISKGLTTGKYLVIPEKTLIGHIEAAREAGWDPQSRGKPFYYVIPSEPASDVGSEVKYWYNIIIDGKFGIFDKDKKDEKWQSFDDCKGYWRKMSIYVRREPPALQDLYIDIPYWYDGVTPFRRPPNLAKDEFQRYIEEALQAGWDPDTKNNNSFNYKISIESIKKRDKDK